MLEIIMIGLVAISVLACLSAMGVGYLYLTNKRVRNIINQKVESLKKKKKVDVAQEEQRATHSPTFQIDEESEVDEFYQESVIQESDDVILHKKLYGLRVNETVVFGRDIPGFITAGEYIVTRTFDLVPMTEHDRTRLWYPKEEEAFKVVEFEGGLKMAYFTCEESGKRNWYVVQDAQGPLNGELFYIGKRPEKGEKVISVDELTTEDILREGPARIFRRAEQGVRIPCPYPSDMKAVPGHELSDIGEVEVHSRFATKQFKPGDFFAFFFSDTADRKICRIHLWGRNMKASDFRDGKARKTEGLGAHLVGHVITLDPEKSDIDDVWELS